MSIISDFIAQQNAYNDQMAASLAGLSDDIKALDDLVKQLQAGQISPEDQAAMDALAAKSKDLADRFAALDALHPPVPPVV